MQKQVAIDNQVMHALRMLGYQTGAGSQPGLYLHRERPEGGPKRLPGESKYVACKRVVPWGIVDFLAAKTPNAHDLAEQLRRYADGEEAGLSPSVEAQVMNTVDKALRKALGNAVLDGTAIADVVRSVVREELAGGQVPQQESEMVASADDLEPKADAEELEAMGAVFDEKGEPAAEPKVAEKPKTKPAAKK